VIASLGERGDMIDCVAVRDDSKFLALGGPDQIVRLWNIEKALLAYSMKQPNPVVCLKFSPDGKTLAVGDANGNIRLLKAESGALSLKSTFVAHKDQPIWSLAFSPDGNQLYTAARDKAASVWDITKPKAIKAASLTGHEVQVRLLSMSADGKRVATVGDQDMQVRLWDASAAAPKTIGTLKAVGRVVSVGIAPDGNTLAVGGAKGVPAILELKGDKLSRITDLDTGGHAATSIGYSPDGNRIVGTSFVSATEDRVLVWDKRGAIQHEFKYGLHVQAAAFTPDGRHLMVITESEPLIVRLPKSE
jgi:WD40 repeat protein